MTLDVPISTVQEYAMKAGELTHKLRRDTEELLAHHAQIRDTHQELMKVCESLQIEESVIFTPELPHFMLNALARYEEHINGSTIAKSQIPETPGRPY